MALVKPWKTEMFSSWRYNVFKNTMWHQILRKGLLCVERELRKTSCFLLGYEYNTCHLAKHDWNFRRFDQRFLLTKFHHSSVPSTQFIITFHPIHTQHDQSMDSCHIPMWNNCLHHPSHIKHISSLPPTCYNAEMLLFCRQPAPCIINWHVPWCPMCLPHICNSSSGSHPTSTLIHLHNQSCPDDPLLILSIVGLAPGSNQYPAIVWLDVLSVENMSTFHFHLSSAESHKCTIAGEGASQLAGWASLMLSDHMWSVIRSAIRVVDNAWASNPTKHALLLTSSVFKQAESAHRSIPPYMYSTTI